KAHTDPDFPGFDLDIPDQHRVDVWLQEFRQFERSGELPQFEIVRLPNDHTKGARAGALSPRSYLADNDLALGRMIDAITHSQFWKDTVVFVLEDDAQNGPDHVDSHRSVMLVISPYNRPGVIHRIANTTDALATMEAILGLDALSQFDYYARPLTDIFADTPDLTPYSVLTPAVPLDEHLSMNVRGAEESSELDFTKEDVADEAVFNRVLWELIKGADVPYPGTRRASMLDMAVPGY
ncbi:MAG TPA: hypothetical protein VFG50_04290, partial [Rhodothermales bacterium]|nr:hypothetical protein [Rhodothermales bacterium]